MLHSIIMTTTPYALLRDISYDCRREACSATGRLAGAQPCADHVTHDGSRDRPQQPVEPNAKCRSVNGVEDIHAERSGRDTQ